MMTGLIRFFVVLVLTIPAASQDGPDSPSGPDRPDDPRADNVLRQRIAELEGALARLETENGRLNVTLMHLGDANTALQDQAGELAASLAQARAVAAQLQDALSQSEGETAYLAQAYEGLLAQIQTLDTSEDPTQNQCAGLEAQMETLQSVISPNPLPANPPTGALAQCQAQIGATLAEIDIITLQMDTLLNERAVLIGRNDDLTAQLDTQTTLHANAVAAFTEQAERLTAQTAQVTELQDQITQLEAQAATREQELTTAQLQMEAQQAEITALVAAAEDQKIAHQERLDAVNAALILARQDLATAQQETQTDQQDLAALEALNTTLQLTIQQIQIDHAGQDAALANAKVELAEMLTALNQERLITQGLKSRLAEMEALLTATAQGQQDGQAPSTTEADALAAALGSVEAERNQLLAQMEALTTEAAARDSQCRQTQAQNQASLTDAQTQAADLLAELAQVQDGRAACLAQIGVLEGKILQRQGLDTVRFELRGATMDEIKAEMDWQILGLDAPFERSGTGAEFTLPEIPGRYQVRALFGDRFVASPFEVLPNQTRTHTFVLAGGEVTLRFDEALPDTYRQQMQVVFTPLHQGQAITHTFLSGLGLSVPLAPGAYTMAVTGAGVSVERRIFVVPSDVTDIILPWQAGLAQLSFVHFQTGEPLQAPVSWRLLRDEALVLTGTGALQLALERGTYRLEAHIGGIRAVKSFSLNDGGLTPVQIPFDQGQINLSFTNMDQPIADAGFYWTLHRLDMAGQDATGQDGLIASGSSEDTALVVPAGRYRLEGFFGNDSRVRELDVDVAGRVPGHLNFSSGVVDITTDLPTDQGLNWRVDRLLGTTVQVSQTFSTDAGHLRYALEPGRYRITVTAGDQQSSALVRLSAGTTTTLHLEQDLE